MNLYGFSWVLFLWYDSLGKPKSVCGRQNSLLYSYTLWWYIVQYWLLYFSNVFQHHINTYTERIIQYIKIFFYTCMTSKIKKPQCNFSFLYQSLNKILKIQKKFACSFSERKWEHFYDFEWGYFQWKLAFRETFLMQKFDFPASYI